MMLRGLFRREPGLLAEDAVAVFEILLPICHWSVVLMIASIDDREH